MPQIIEQQGSPIGRLGKGIGKGLADQLPKEIDRYRLTTGLDKFAQESKGKSPFQQAVDFYKIPGTTAEMGYTLFPLLSQEARREAAKDFGKGVGESQYQPKGSSGINVDIVASGDEGNLKPIPRGKIEGQQKSQDQIKALKSAETTQRQLEPIVHRSEDELFKEAISMSNANPLLFPTPESALPTVKGNENARLLNLQEQRNVGNTADALKQKVLTGIEQSWNKDNTLKDIEGTIQSKFFEKAEKELAEGKKSESKIISEMREAGKEVAQAKTNLVEAGNKRSWFINPRSIRQAIPGIRDVYHKYGAGEEFEDLLAANLKISPHIAAEYEQPHTKAHKDYFKTLFKEIGEPKKTSIGDFIRSGKYTPSEYNKEDVNKISLKFADDISDIIHEDTNILSLVAEAKRRHLDPNIIMKRVKRNQEDGLIKLTPRQLRQFNKVIPDLPTLGDFYISSKLDDDEMVE